MKTAFLLAMLVSSACYAENGGPGIDHGGGGSTGSHSGGSGDPSFVGQYKGTAQFTDFNTGQKVTGKLSGTASVTANFTTGAVSESLNNVSVTVGGFSRNYGNITGNGTLVGGSFSNPATGIGTVGTFVGKISGSISGSAVNGSFSGGDVCCSTASGSFSAHDKN